MKNKLPNKYTMQIIDNKIVNLDSIINEISLEENFELLKEYQAFLKGHLDIADASDIYSILNFINNKLIKLEQSTNEFYTYLDNIQNIYVTDEEAVKLLSHFVNNDVLSEEDIKKVYAYLSNQIALIEYGYNESLAPNELDILNYVIDYMKTTDMNAIKSYLINRYESVYKSDENAFKKSNGRTKKLLNPSTPLSLDDEGISLSIIIITITILLGAIIATILLVK